MVFLGTNKGELICLQVLNLEIIKKQEFKLEKKGIVTSIVVKNISNKRFEILTTQSSGILTILEFTLEKIDIKMKYISQITKGSLEKVYRFLFRFVSVMTTFIYLDFINQGFSFLTRLKNVKFTLTNVEAEGIII